MKRTILTIVGISVSACNLAYAASSKKQCQADFDLMKSNPKTVLRAPIIERINRYYRSQFPPGYGKVQRIAKSLHPFDSKTFVDVSGKHPGSHKVRCTGVFNVTFPLYRYEPGPNGGWTDKIGTCSVEVKCKWVRHSYKTGMVCPLFKRETLSCGP